MRLDGKTALITGGNSGIGLAHGAGFHQRGGRASRSPGEMRRRSRKQRPAWGPNAVALRADITDFAANEAAIRSAAETLGHFDIVVANAGISGNTPVGGTTAEQFERILTTNVTGVFLTVQRGGAVPAQGRFGGADRFGA